MRNRARTEKSEEQLAGEAMFWKWVRGTLYIVVAMTMFGYWWGFFILRPSLRATFKQILGLR